MSTDPDSVSYLEGMWYHRFVHLCGCNQQEVYSDTQVPGATKSLGGLARPQVGGNGFIYVLGSKKRGTEARSIVTGFSLVSLNVAELRSGTRSLVPENSDMG